MSVKEFVGKLLDKYLDITDGYWSIKIENMNGKHVYSVYHDNEMLVYQEPIKENAVNENK